MLEKDATREAVHCKDQFVSHLFLVSQKDGGQRPVVKLKELKTFIPYKHFKMEGFIHLRKLWNKATICASWTSNTPIKQTVKEIYTSQMGGFLLRIPLSVFRFGPVPRLFTK